MSDEEFTHDVFLCHSSSDKAVVRSIAKRLNADGVSVWLDEWELRPGDNIPVSIENALEHSRVLAFFMSRGAFGSEWATLESQTFRFRDPLNRERRFIPVRLDDTPLKGSLGSFLYIDWRKEEREREYVKLLEACRPAIDLLPPWDSVRTANARVDTPLGDLQPWSSIVSTPKPEDIRAERGFRALGGHGGRIFSIKFSRDSRWIASGSADCMIKVWEAATGRCALNLKGHEGPAREIVFGPNDRLYSGSEDTTVRAWALATGATIGVGEGHRSAVYGLALSPDGKFLVSASRDGSMRVWDTDTMVCTAVLSYGAAWVNTVAVTPDGTRVIAGTEDGHVTVWDLARKRKALDVRFHQMWVWSLALSADGSRMISGSGDSTVGVWDPRDLEPLGFLEGHQDKVSKVAITDDGRWAVSASLDGTARVWDLNSGETVQILEGHRGSVECVAISADGRVVATGADDSLVRLWDFAPGRRESPPVEMAARYTNAKVLLVGETSVGKTGLSRVLSGHAWQPTDSTVGSWATQWKLDVAPADGTEREIWLWDFGGQADQRLIHQLYMDETSVAVLVFDGQKEDVFETLGQWDRDLTRASHRPFSKLLVAGRVDVGALRVSRGQIESFASERGFTGKLIETSAKSGTGCKELAAAIVDSIHWEDIPWRSSPVLFKLLKEEIVRLKDAGRVLMRFNELRETLMLRVAGKGVRFTDDELKAVITLMTGPGVVWELKFGSLVLLQPERINAYAQAVIQTMREDEHERGCISEERVLNGNLVYQSSVARLEPDDERIVLLSMHQTLVERGLCLREPTSTGTLLVFPSYYRRERPELVGHPAVLVSYRFTGFIDDIYATLVVRLHHTDSVQKQQLWRYAADFTTLAGKPFGIKVTRRSEGAGELDVYFDPAISNGEKIIISKYVHEHLLRKAADVVRFRHYVCTHCGTLVGNREVAMERLEAWLAETLEAGWVADAALAPPSSGYPPAPSIICARCEKRVPLWDELEQYFADPAVKSKVTEMQTASALVLDSESKERVLVGEVISTVSLAGQISREFNVSDHGIDFEIEFKSDAGQATGRKVYLQLKSGDSYLRKRQRDGAEIFRIETPRHAEYWASQAFPVFLLIRSSRGEIRWMEVREYLQRERRNSGKPVRQIVFDGQRFDVMSVRRWRDEALRSTP